jgi:squalene synthase HpnC
MLPRRLRGPVAVIRAFARSVNELVDEGRFNASERLMHLAGYEAKLDIIKAGGFLNESLFLALADTVRQHALPMQPFYDLLVAARLDVVKKRYTHFAELMEYCRYSANPVGRLLLHLYGAETPRDLGYSDAICTALQMIGFIQNLAQDYHGRGRIYLPQDEMARFGVTEAHIRGRCNDAALRRLIDFQIERAQRLLQAGAPLGKALRGRAGLEMRLLLAGGARRLHLLRTRRDPFLRPRLTKRDWAWMIWRVLFKPYPT